MPSTLAAVSSVVITFYDYCYYYYICIIITILCNAFEMSFTRDIAMVQNALKKKKCCPSALVCVFYVCIYKYYIY